MEGLAPGMGEAVKSAGICLEGVRNSAHVDDGLAFEGAQQVDIIGRQEGPNGSKVLAVQRGLLEIQQSQINGFAARNDGHTAAAIVGNAPLPTLPFCKGVCTNKAAEALGGDPGFFGGSALVAGRSKEPERSF